MHVLLLLSGFYLGGVFFCLLDGWIRDDDPFRNEALFGAVAWPLVVVWFSILGRDKAREATGISPTRDLSVISERLEALPVNPVQDDFDIVKSHLEAARCRALAEALLQIDFYRLDIESEGRPADLLELTRRIHALFDLEPPQAPEGEGRPADIVELTHRINDIFDLEPEQAPEDEDQQGTP